MAFQIIENGIGERCVSSTKGLHRTRSYRATYTRSDLCDFSTATFLFSCSEQAGYRLKLSGIATTAGLTKKNEAVLGQYWNGRPIDKAIITFKYNVGSGEAVEIRQTVTKSSVANLSVDNEFSVWHDRAYPDRGLTPWNDDPNATEMRIIGFILLLVFVTAVVFAVTRPENRSRLAEWLFRPLFGLKIPRENKLYRSSFASIGLGDGFASVAAVG